MLLSAGAKLGAYEILAPLGAGGMGVVYRARDTRLNRTVALKLLPPDKVADPVRKQRFFQEARAASALNHPNIITIHDFGEDGERSWIVMEYVAGRTLAEVIGKQGLPVAELLRYAIPIAESLSCAHAAGIVHRDLKPGNVMVGEDGRVKVLDFGLAKLTERGDSDSLAPTHTLGAATEEGVVLGTTAYMSPEQAEGRKVDTRSDIFSFGAVLYEMATGRRAFTGATPMSTVAAVLKGEPPGVRQLNPAVPRELERVISRCLRKNPAQRFQVIDDVRMDLEDLTPAAPDSAPQHPSGTRRTKWWALASGIAVLSLAAGFGLAWRFVPGSAPGPLTFRFRPLITEAEVETQPAWSPDGKVLAYVSSIDGISQVFFRDLGSPASVQITKSSTACSYPFWSPDGARIYYHASGHLWSVGAAGGAPTRVMDNVSRATISPDGKTLVFSRGPISAANLWVVAADGADPQPYRTSPFRAFSTAVAQFSPDGSKIAVHVSRGIQSGEFWILPFPSGTPRRVLQSLSANAAIPQQIGWMRDNRRLVFGAAVPGIPGTHLYLGDIETDTIRPLTSGTSDEQFPAVSPDGRRIAFASGGTDFDLFEVPLNGDPVRPLLATSRSEQYPNWAPSGTQYAYTTDASGTPELWLRSVQEGWARPLVTVGLQGTADWVRLERPVFSPDGQRVAYDVYSQRHGIWISPVAGGRPVQLDAATSDQHMPSWSPDGAWIAYRRQRAGKWELAKAPFGGGTPVVLVEDVATSGVGGGPVPWSPSGDWIAFRKVEPGLYLVSPDSKRTRQLTSYTPAVYDFSKDGADFYSVHRLPDRSWAVTLVEVASGKERKTVELAILPAANLAGFSLHPDGTRFATGLGVPKSDIWLLDGLPTQ
jgi:Tol biopolymer transport system component